jgi:hypothetical protein
MAYVVREADGTCRTVHGVRDADVAVANVRRTCTFYAWVERQDRVDFAIASVYKQRSAFAAQLRDEHGLDVQEHKCVLDTLLSGDRVSVMLTLTFTAVPLLLPVA